MKCSRCGADKASTEFYERNTRKKRGRGKDSWCKQCRRVGDQEWRAANPEAAERGRAGVRAWHKAHQEHVRAQKRLRHYGVTPADYQSMLDAQEGKCAICAEPFSATPHVDHDHATNKVRALLCLLCNVGLAKFRDSPMFMRTAADYIEHHKIPLHLIVEREA